MFCLRFVQGLPSGLIFHCLCAFIDDLTISCIDPVSISLPVISKANFIDDRSIIELGDVASNLVNLVSRHSCILECLFPGSTLPEGILRFSGFLLLCFFLFRFIRVCLFLCHNLIFT